VGHVELHNPPLTQELGLPGGKVGGGRWEVGVGWTEPRDLIGAWELKRHFSRAGRQTLGHLMVHVEHMHLGQSNRLLQRGPSPHKES
jgi:hypothetical protein